MALRMNPNGKPDTMMTTDNQKPVKAPSAPREGGKGQSLKRETEREASGTHSTAEGFKSNTPGASVSSKG